MFTAEINLNQKSHQSQSDPGKTTFLIRLSVHTKLEEQLIELLASV